MKKDLDIFIFIGGAFLAFYFIPAFSPASSSPIMNSIISGLSLLNEYARFHVITCLLPAFFIAGAINVFIKKEYITKYLSGQNKTAISYLLASISGIFLSVCSCAILPLFAGIRKKEAGLGPAITFLFAGPAINIAAIFLTMSVLGMEIGMARIIGAIVLSIFIGISMQKIFKEKTEKGNLYIEEKEKAEVNGKSLILFFSAWVGILITNGLQIDQSSKYSIILILSLVILYLSLLDFEFDTTKEWIKETWYFFKTIMPILFVGVFMIGFIMPFIPQNLVIDLVGSNSISSNLIAALFGSFMYFSTLTEIPILQALIDNGMNKGPALTMLLADPALSLPSILVLKTILGAKKTITYVSLIILFSIIGGMFFGVIL